MEPSLPRAMAGEAGADLRSRSFQLAMIQMRVDGGAVKTNLDRASRRLEAARAAGADVALLPEAVDLGWTHPAALTEARPIPDGEPCRRLAADARKHGLLVCAGLTERAGDRVYNAAVLISPAGEVILHHRKLNELEIGHACYAQGDRLGVVETAFGRFGLMICSDAFVRGQTVGRTLGLMGADVILSPCAWAVPADHDNTREPYGALWLEHYGPVARDFRLWIAGVSNVGPITAGPWCGRKCIGNSLLIDPAGQTARCGPHGEAAETILHAGIRTVPRPARAAGWETVWGENRGP